jgi:hypothetical protein
MRDRTGFAVVLAFAVAGSPACAATDLMPIRGGPGSDADSGPAGGGDANAVEPAAVDAGTVDGGNTPCKRGIAIGGDAGPPSALAPAAHTPGVWWWYNWGSKNTGGDPRVEYVPMLWGSGSLNDTIPAAAQYLLGFNEPNFKPPQSNLRAQQAAADWPMVEMKAAAKSIPIVSPGVNFCGSASDSSRCSDPAVTDPYTYLRDFFAACSGCKVDYIGVHAYYCDVPSLRAYLEGNTATGGSQGFLQFGKPLWLTEFACPLANSVAEQKAYMQAAVPYLENNSNVMRYAWFSAKPIPNAELINSDGSLTDLGATYVALPQGCH